MSSVDCDVLTALAYIIILILISKVRTRFKLILNSLGTCGSFWTSGLLLEAIQESPLVFSRVYTKNSWPCNGAAIAAHAHSSDHLTPTYMAILGIISWWETGIRYNLSVWTHWKPLKFLDGKATRLRALNSGAWNLIEHISASHSLSPNWNRKVSIIAPCASLFDNHSLGPCLFVCYFPVCLFVITVLSANNFIVGSLTQR